MPRNGAITFRDIAGKLTVLRITCDKCGRSGQYRVDRLIMRYGIDAKVFCEDLLMSSEVPIEIEDKPTSVGIMRELVEHLPDTIEALKREIVRNPKSDEYRKALKGTGERLTIAKQILGREEARASLSP
jgi:hypothetical protein